LNLKLEIVQGILCTWLTISSAASLKDRDGLGHGFRNAGRGED
jgi:hypothetical protein